MAFAGFRRESIQFLSDLASHNDRAWFQPRKGDYERLLRDPLEELIVALGERFAAQRLPLEADPKRSPFRIYRDVRFSKDKSPYKTNLGASFPLIDPPGPGGYFHFSPGEMFVGGGMWHPDPAMLNQFRARVAADPSPIRTLLAEPAFVDSFGGRFGEGDHQLKRVPAGFPADHPAADILRQKDLTFGRRLPDVEALSPDLPDILAHHLAVAVPILRYLAGAPVEVSTPVPA